MGGAVRSFGQLRPPSSRAPAATTHTGSRPGQVMRRKSGRPTLASGPSKPRQRPTLPQGCPYSTIGPEELNFRVRDGNGCDLSGIAARKKNHEVRSSAGSTSWSDIHSIVLL